MPLEIDDQFHVVQKIESKDKNGMIISRFLPGFTYTVTKRNLPDIQESPYAVKGRTTGEKKANVAVNSPKGRVTVKDKE